MRSEGEQKILNECSRLIANSIILYNATILSQLLSEAEKKGNIEEAEIIKKISPIAWQHINLYGRYLFHQRSAMVNIEELVTSLKIDKRYLTKSNSA